MARFWLNRNIAITMALAACLATWAFGTASATGIGDAKDKPSTEIPDGDPHGDPDLPVGPSRGQQVGAQRGGSSSSRTTIAGDDRVLDGYWWWRLRMVLQSLRALHLRD
jgi:hypothetical protein